MGRLRVHEIFQSIPDHGPFAGKVSTFVVLAEQSVYFAAAEAPVDRARWQGEVLSLDRIVSRIPAAPERVVISRVDAAHQKPLDDLISLLAPAHRIVIEANATYPIATLPTDTPGVIEVYGPSADRFCEPQGVLWEGLRPGDRVRFYVNGETDARWVNSLCIAHQLWTRTEVDIVPIGGLSVLEFISFPDPASNAERSHPNATEATDGL